MKFSLSEAFKDRKFKYSGTATLLVVSVVAVTLIINLLFSLTNIRLDTTPTKFFSISDKTMSILNRVEDDIDIYFLYMAGGEDTNVMELAARYESASDHISTRLIDPIANPHFVDEYMTDKHKASTTPGAGDVIVGCNSTKKFAVLTSDDFYSYEYDPEDSTTITNVYFEGEQAFTNAISAVTCKEDYTIGLLKGHNEDSIPEAMLTVMGNMFINVVEVNIEKDKAIPSEVDVMVVLTPEFDLKDNEVDIFLSWLDAKDSAGDAIFVMGKATTPTPNFDKIMESYSLVLGKETIYEEDLSKYAAGNKYALLLRHNTSAAATKLVGISSYMYLESARPIYTTELVKETVNIAGIANTSTYAWASDKVKTDPFEPEEGDIFATKNGFVPVVQAVNFKNNEETQYSRIMVVNCPNFMLGDQTRLNAYSNDEIFYSAMYWCLDNPSTVITLTPKYYITSTHTLATSGLRIYLAVICIIPLAILVAGASVFLVRRRL